jgi:hypothetical protein
VDKFCPRLILIGGPGEYVSSCLACSPNSRTEAKGEGFQPKNAAENSGDFSRKPEPKSAPVSPILFRRKQRNKTAIRGMRKTHEIGPK